MSNNPVNVAKQSSDKLAYVWGILSRQKWYGHSSSLIRDQLNKLGEESIGYLLRLSQKLNTSPDREIIEIISIVHSQKLVITTYKTRSLLTNEIFMEDYVSLIDGEDVMTRGVVIIQDTKDNLKYIVYPKHGLIAMHYPDFKSQKTITTPIKVERLLKHFLSTDKLSISKFIDLGKVDSGLGYFDNGEIGLFALVITCDDVKPFNGDDMNIIKIGGIFDSLDNVKNTLLLSIILRLNVLKLLK